MLRPMMGPEDLRAVLSELLGKRLVPYLRSMLSGSDLGAALMPVCLEGVVRSLEGLNQQGTNMQQFQVGVAATCRSPYPPSIADCFCFSAL